MKKIFKFLLYAILFFILILTVYLVYIKFFASKGNVNAFNTVPKESVFVVETTNLSEAWSAINRSELWQHLIQTNYFGDLNTDINLVNTFLDSNIVANKLFKNKKLIVSAVMASSRDWNFLFSVDLDKASATVKVLDNLIDLISGYNVTRIRMKSNGKHYEIIKMTDKKNPNSSIYISIDDNVLLVSFNASIIQKSIEEQNDEHWKKDKKFKQIMEADPGRKLFKIYINYSNLDAFTGTFLTKEDPIISMLSKSLCYSILDLDFTENMILLDGFANVDSIGGYIHTLAKIKPGRLNSYSIMSNQTAAFVSISFDNYKNFYNSLINEYKKSSPKDVEEINKYIKLLKNIMKIDIRKDLFSWIGNEIALYKIRPLSKVSRAEDMVMLVNAKNIDDAKAGMAHIVNQIRKRSPMKFKNYNYNGFQINYLKQKNFFKPFFGKLFEGIEEPYFTFIEKYVVFSNSEEVLKQIIDDYNAGRIIANNDKFQSFIDEFEVKSNIAVFINMPKMYPTLYYYTLYQDKKDLKKNEELIKSFDYVGLQLVSKGKMFKTSLFTQYDSSAYYEDLTELLNAKAGSDNFSEYIDTLGFLLALPKKLTDGNYSEYFDPTNKELKIEGNVVNGKPDGLWRTYYLSGNIKSAFTYNKGNVEGVGFFYFDDVANTLRAQVTFVNNRPDGLYKEYFNNGARKANILYNNGEKEGDASFYYKTGEIQIKGKFSSNKRQGRWLYFDENGKRIAVERYRHGEKAR